VTDQQGLIFAYGNPSRGDDALGPELLAALLESGLQGVCFQEDMQLQVEHVMDMQGVKRVVFVDADASCPAPFQWEKIQAEKDSSYTSHAMTPHALLYAYQKVYGETPPISYLLRIRGYDFELGEPLTAMGRENLEHALAFVQEQVVNSIRP